MSAEVAATNPQPKTKQAVIAARMFPAPSPRVAVAAATLAAVSSQARAGCNPLNHRDVTTVAVPPVPRAIQASMETEPLAPSATSWVRP